jgi:uncharacterized protein (UPF0332 family)
VSESVLFLEKAERSLNAAELLLENGDVDIAASRVYYAWFYVAESLLLTRGLRFTRHGQVNAQYGNLFARTGLLDPEFHRFLLRAFNLRQMADYWSHVDLVAEEILHLVEEGRRFLKAAREYLEALPPKSGGPEASPAAAEE